MRLAVASGKGGTGKTLVSTSLAWWLSQRGYAVGLADADVEEPNAHLFLQPNLGEEARHSVLIPVVDQDRCTGCGACQEACAFHAILAVPGNWMLFPELCHSCGLCVRVCPERALHEETRELGTLRQDSQGDIVFLDGVLDVGEARATPVVDGVIAALPRQREVTVIDCPPGTSCATMAAVRTADLVLLVAEPTPFGLHDLRLAVEMCRALQRPVAAILNRADLGDDDVAEYLDEEDIPLLAEIPFDPELARALAGGEVGARVSTTVAAAMAAVLDHITGEA